MNNPAAHPDQTMSAADLPCAVVQSGRRKYLTRLSFGQIAEHQERVRQHESSRVRKFGIGFAVLFALITLISLAGGGAKFLLFMLLAIAFCATMAAHSIRARKTEAALAKFERDYFLQETTSASPDAVDYIFQVEELAQRIHAGLTAMTEAGVTIPAWTHDIRIDLLHVAGWLSEEWFHGNHLDPHFARLEESAVALEGVVGQ